MPFSTYLANAVINHTLRNTTYTPPSTVYVALFTTTATTVELKAGTLTNEVSGGSYARLALSLNAPAAGATDSSALMSWTGMPSVTVGYVGFMDGSTLAAGNILMYGALALPRAVTGGQFDIAAGDIDVVLN